MNTTIPGNIFSLSIVMYLVGELFVWNYLHLRYVCKIGLLEDYIVLMTKTAGFQPKNVVKKLLC